MINISKIDWSKRKTLSIQVTQSGEVVVKAPEKLSISKIQEFIQEKESWILSKIKNKTDINSKFEDIISYKKLLIFGKEYIGVSSSTVKQIGVFDDKVCIPQKYVNDRLHKIIVKWYKELANSHLIKRTEEIAKITGLLPKTIKCTGSRGRWGACNNKSQLFLNFRLCMLPPKLIDYVIVHELAHLKELNHSANFWALVEKFLPDYKSRRKLIKDYGFCLKLF